MMLALAGKPFAVLSGALNRFQSPRNRFLEEGADLDL